jgi:hypothetical protein
MNASVTPIGQLHHTIITQLHLACKMAPGWFLMFRGLLAGCPARHAVPLNSPCSRSLDADTMISNWLPMCKKDAMHHLASVCSQLQLSTVM